MSSRPNIPRRNKTLYALAVMLLTVYLQLLLWCWALAGEWFWPVFIGLCVTSLASMTVIYFLPVTVVAGSLPLPGIEKLDNSVWQQALKRLSRLYRLPEPLLFRVASSEVLAYASGAADRRSWIAVDDTLLNEFTHSEVEAILAHEFSHIALGHARQLTLLQAAILPWILPWAWLLGNLRDHNHHSDLKIGRSTRRWMVYLTYLLLPLTGMVVNLILHRWEYAADQHASRMIGKEKLLATLRCLFGICMPEANWSQVTAFNRHGLRNMISRFSSHPGIPQRINALWRS